MALRKIVSKFNAWQQVRTLLHKLADSKMPLADLLDKKLRMTSTLSLSSPDGQVVKIEEESPNDPMAITLWQNGLTGALGALPLAYSEWMTERYYRYGDLSAKAFISLFEHRLYCLSYLAWQKNRLYVRAEFEPGIVLKQEVLALCGLLNTRPVSMDERYGHLFALPVRSLVNLGIWLSHYYRVPVTITPFICVWQPVAASERCRLGCSRRTLGVAPIIGEGRKDMQSHFRVTIGPVTDAASHAFLPGGSHYRDIRVRIRQYVGLTLNFSIYIIIINDLLPLGNARLGLNAVMGTADFRATHQVCLLRGEV